MSIYEYDQERHMRQEREQSYEKGLADGHAQGFTEGHARGFTDGQAKGLAEGHAQGFTDGHVQGVAEGQRSMAVNLARSGMAAEEIARVAETDVELVREWIQEQI